MLTREQKLILALRVNEKKEVIFAKYGPGVTKKKKEEANPKSEKINSNTDTYKGRARPEQVKSHLT